MRPHASLPQYYGSDDQRQGFVNALFDDTAQHYDWICKAMSLGSGQMYRRMALERTGIRAGMTILDVATGTGGIARAALDIVKDPTHVVGLDPSFGMLRECRRRLPVRVVRGRAEVLPFSEGRFDRLSMGYALRHVADLHITFKEYLRVLKPGGRLLVLEITRPRSALGRLLVGVYLKHIVPQVARFGTRSDRAKTLMQYYWDTIEQCVSPDDILAALRTSGFVDVERTVTGGILSEYLGTKP